MTAASNRRDRRFHPQVFGAVMRSARRLASICRNEVITRLILAPVTVDRS
jgi:hypothetical protein